MIFSFTYFQIYTKFTKKLALMSNKLLKYGINVIDRPKIPATKRLNLTGEQGQQIVKSETKLVLRTHKETFKRLADMS